MCDLKLEIDLRLSRHMVRASSPPLSDDDNSAVLGRDEKLRLFIASVRAAPERRPRSENTSRRLPNAGVMSLLQAWMRTLTSARIGSTLSNSSFTPESGSLKTNGLGRN